MGLRQQEDLNQPMEYCGVQFQMEHHEDIMLEACRPLWWQWTCEDMLKSGSPIVSMGEQSTSLHQANAIKKGGPS